MENEFDVQLNRVKANSSNLISSDTQVEEVYGVSRSFSIESESSAIEKSVKDTDIDLINR